MTTGYLFRNPELDRPVPVSPFYSWWKAVNPRRPAAFHQGLSRCLIVLPKIISSRQKTIRILCHQADRRIAPVAQEAAHSSGLVAMIDDQPECLCRLLTTDRATSLLPSRHLNLLNQSDPVFTLESRVSPGVGLWGDRISRLTPLPLCMIPSLRKFGVGDSPCAILSILLIVVPGSRPSACGLLTTLV